MTVFSINVLAQEANNDMAGQETFDAVVGKASDLIEQLHIPGLSVGVIHGANSYATGIGVANVSTKEPVTADTEFHIASVTKTFTATLAMILSEKGVLDLNARIVDILPWFRVKDPEATAKARVIDLFHHHTGWSGDHGFDPVSPGGSITEKCMLQAHYIEQIVPFDQAWMYSNTNLAFAGHHAVGRRWKTLRDARRRAHTLPARHECDKLQLQHLPSRRKFRLGSSTDLYRRQDRRTSSRSSRHSPRRPGPPAESNPPFRTC